MRLHDKKYPIKADFDSVIMHSCVGQTIVSGTPFAPPAMILRVMVYNLDKFDDHSNDKRAEEFGNLMAGSEEI